MGIYGNSVVEYAVPCLVIWAALAASIALDRSRFRNCIVLLMAAASTVPFLCALTGSYFGQTARVFSVITLMVLLWVPVVLIANGVIMYQREGRSLANMLSLLLGIVVGAGEICTFIFYVIPYYWNAEDAQLITTAMKVLLFISLTITYGSLIFVAFMCYTVLLQVIPSRRNFDFVIIHGSGLIRGNKVSKLLSDRIDRAIEVYRKDPTPPIVIPSGGKGSDETISEAEAMEGYLIEHGIPKEQIIKEDASTTTRENLLYSRRIIEECGGGHTALVTSNYHVYRALSICRDLDFACTGIGAHVAPYYWPSALIREFVAIMTKKTNLLIFVAGWIVCVMPVLYRIMGMVSQ